MTEPAIGQRYDASFGRYRVIRIDGDVVVMQDLADSTRCVTPTRDKIGPGLNFELVDETKPPPKAKTAPAKLKPATSIVGVPYHPHPTEAEVCPYLAKLGRHRCGFVACVPACPRAGGDAAAAAPVVERRADPPPLTALELAAIWARVGVERPAVPHENQPPDATSAPVGDAPPAADDPTPEPVVASEPSPASFRQDGISAPAVVPTREEAPPPATPDEDRPAVHHVDVPPDAMSAPAGDAPPAAPDPTSSPAEPSDRACAVCGVVRVVMLALIDRRNRIFFICSGCAQGRHDEHTRAHQARMRRL